MTGLPVGTGAVSMSVERPRLRPWSETEQVVGSVKKSCGLVVAADPMSRSAKARRARDLGVRVIGVADFVTLVTERSR